MKNSIKVERAKKNITQADLAILAKLVDKQLMLWNWGNMFHQQFCL